MAATFFANRVSTQTNAVTSAWSQVCSPSPRVISPRFACRGSLDRGDALDTRATVAAAVREVQPQDASHSPRVGWARACTLVVKVN